MVKSQYVLQVYIAICFWHIVTTLTNSAAIFGHINEYKVVAIDRHYAGLNRFVAHSQIEFLKSLLKWICVV